MVSVPGTAVTIATRLGVNTSAHAAGRPSTTSSPPLSWPLLLRALPAAARGARRTCPRAAATSSRATTLELRPVAARDAALAEALAPLHGQVGALLVPADATCSTAPAPSRCSAASADIGRDRDGGAARARGQRRRDVPGGDAAHEGAGQEARGAAAHRRGADRARGRRAARSGGGRGHRPAARGSGRCASRTARRSSIDDLRATGDDAPTRRRRRPTG